MLNLLSKVEGEEEKGVNNLFSPLKLNIWKDMITILILFCPELPVWVAVLS